MTLLQQRKKNVESRMEVEGVRMIPLKTLVVPFDECPILSELRELVGEVLDLRSVPNYIEIGI